MNEESNNNCIDPELEARIVALVHGEASAIEREQLNRLIDERPELAALKNQIQGVHGLLCDVGTGGWSEHDDENWKLPTEKRCAVLVAIHGESRQKSVSKPLILQMLSRRHARWRLVRIAAVVCGAGLFGLMAVMTLLVTRAGRVAQSKQFGDTALYEETRVAAELQAARAKVRLSRAEPKRGSIATFGIRLEDRSGLKPELKSEREPVVLEFNIDGEPGLRRQSELSAGRNLRASGLSRGVELSIAEKKWESQGISPAKKPATTAAGLNEINAKDQAFSTFSLYVSDISFKLALAALARGEWPEADEVRIEEFVNALDYGDPLPNKNEPVACRVEQSIHPFLQQRNLLRVRCGRCSKSNYPVHPSVFGRFP